MRTISSLYVFVETTYSKEYFNDMQFTRPSLLFTCFKVFLSEVVVTVTPVGPVVVVVESQVHVLSFLQEAKQIAKKTTSNKVNFFIV